MAEHGMDPGFRTRVRSGEQSAFAVLFEECGRAVYNHCFRLTGDWAVAEDCVSLVFLEAWRLRAKIDAEGGSLLPWLLGVATNVVRRHWRVARRHRAVLEQMPPPASLPDFAEELASRLDDQERIAELRRVLSALPRADREVLALCVWSGLDYAAAAEALGVPVGTVRSRLSRARARLEKLVDRNLVTNRELVRTAGQREGDDQSAEGETR
ncbi:RNA polymerase sigma factor [Crossiella cryophila]|uniref:RNA polymerase sigma-70 factor (ECF subfamily) n=1 Tax=Crossiella cryophila TaxID=43355 RepID=A0A7W7FVR0_9PSEU|nr:RNA polymerase sigma factor [Crossiella cryophila]MBB4678743.1 RNA polymerase sigma-70 factor (ECF subfamily) [Crossiella cryophila]